MYHWSTLKLFFNLELLKPLLLLPFLEALDPRLDPLLENRHPHYIATVINVSLEDIYLIEHAPVVSRGVPLILLYELNLVLDRLDLYIVYLLLEFVLSIKLLLPDDLHIILQWHKLKVF